MPLRKSEIVLLRVKFWQRVDKAGPVHPVCGQCWVWTGYRMKHGYGKLTTWNKSLPEALVHRFSWYIHNGSVPAGLSVLHKCDNRACVNPDHLFLGTQQDNLADMRAKGHQVRGERQGSAKLDDDKVREIRRQLSGRSNKKVAERLAREYDVGIGQILRAAKYFSWKHVK